MRAIITTYDGSIQSVNIVNDDEAERATNLLRTAANNSSHDGVWRVRNVAVDPVQITLDHCFS